MFGFLLSHLLWVEGTPTTRAAATRQVSLSKIGGLGFVLSKLFQNTYQQRRKDLYSQTFKYHIRGNLRGYNLDANNNLMNSLFSLKLGYEDANFYDGNIGKQEWRSSLDNVTRSFTYGYDVASRITQGIYAGTGTENYSLNSVTYDLNGNIKTLSRSGYKSTNAFGLVDNLNYSYQKYSNKIQKVDDLSNETASFKDVSGATDYTYYPDGSLKSDANKGINLIEYNYLKRPKKYTFSNGSTLENQYDATGKKLKSISSDGTIYDFVGNKIYKNDVLYQISHDEGRIVDGIYEYNITDHLGNLRVAFKDSSGIAKIIQVNAYGAFGDNLPTLKYVNSTKKNRFGFNLKEEENDFGVGYNDFKWRFSDQILGRFFTIDPLSEKTFNISSYAYANNNPVNMVDKDGRYAVSVHYDITYEALRGLGYSKKQADLIAHYSSTYADHPPETARFLDFMLHPLQIDPHVYRPGVDYSKTADSQEEKNRLVAY